MALMILNFSACALPINVKHHQLNQLLCPITEPIALLVRALLPRFRAFGGEKSQPRRFTRRLKPADGVTCSSACQVAGGCF